MASAFHTLNEEQILFSTGDERMIFNTVGDHSSEQTITTAAVATATSGNTIQNIKSMKNLKATIMGNQHHIKQQSNQHVSKFKISEKDIRNSK
jgi:hypothetical protein